MSSSQFIGIPAKAKMQYFQSLLDYDLRWSDGMGTFHEAIKVTMFRSLSIGICNLFGIRAAQALAPRVVLEIWCFKSGIFTPPLSV